jgi:CRP/FNR family nitrogen fixation transcriptional regulator
MNHVSPRDSDLSHVPREVEALGTVASYRGGEQIYRQGSHALQLYRVISGQARKCLNTASGRRRIVDFLLPGDYFGFTTADRHLFGVEAVSSGTLIARYPRGEVERIATWDPSVAAIIREAAFETISRLQARLLIVGRMSAQGKVSAFLLSMAGSHSDRTPDMCMLPMSRYDIADYLGISVETVSRALTHLKQHHTIKVVDARCIEIVDRAGLTRNADDDDMDGLRLSC